MRITVTSVYVVDHEKARRFYTDVLGFVKKADHPGAVSLAHGGGLVPRGQKLLG